MKSHGLADPDRCTDIQRPGHNQVCLQMQTHREPASEQKFTGTGNTHHGEIHRARDSCAESALQRHAEL